MLSWWLAAVIPLLSLVVLSLVRRRSSEEVRCTIDTAAGDGSVLLITAHPDDECMFFAPTLLTLTRTTATGTPRKVFLLCLSEGDYYGKGDVRRHELVKSAAILGLHSSDISVVNDRDLPDSPSVEWNMDVVAGHILEAVKQQEIETIITFDEGGVSGHANHIAICNTVKRLHQRDLLRNAGVKRVFLLETTNVIRKYTSWLDVVWRSLANSSKVDATVNIVSYLKARSAMRAHRSQYVWFRRLYVTFSRYMVTNTFRELTHNT